MKKRYHIKYYNVQRFDILDTTDTRYKVGKWTMPVFARCFSKGNAHVVADALNKSVGIRSTSSNNKRVKSLCESCCQEFSWCPTVSRV